MAGKVRARPAITSDDRRAMTDGSHCGESISATATSATPVVKSRPQKTKVATKLALSKRKPRAKKPIVKKPVVEKPIVKKKIARPLVSPDPPVAPLVEPEAGIAAPIKRRSVTGRALITRVARAVERELTEIEAIVGSTKNRTESERRARTLASLARTLGEVTRLREQQQAKREDDDDAVPRDLDEFRITLARRLEKILADRSQRPVGDDEPRGA